jgi:methionyl-tRNA formyltransferase
VKEVAEELELEIVQPEKPKGEEFLDRIGALGPDVSVVAAYGEILTEPVLELPERGSVNVHASLLPKLRGAAPVNWAVIRGHDRSGVTIMRMVRELDAGPILRQAEVPLPAGVTAGSLFEELSRLGADLLVETLADLAAGRVEEREQDHDRATYAPKLDRETARLDWSATAEELDRWIRGCDPWPAAWSELQREDDDPLPVQLFGSDPGHTAPPAGPEPAADPGTVVLADPREGLRVATGRGALAVDEVKPAGRSRMEAAAWIRGRGVSEGQRFR